MPSLSETQSCFRAAIAGSEAAALVATLRAPADVAGRLEIYRRHYRESFRRHLRGRYPTIEWLLGTERLIALCDATLQQFPPRAPSLAEYGAELLDCVFAAADLPPYIADVARIDWALGTLSVAVAHDPLQLAVLATVAAERLSRLRLTLQPGLAYVESSWPVDDLVHLRLAESQPEQLDFAPRRTHLQLHGARGQFALQRLTPHGFAFRASLAAGSTLAEAVTRAGQSAPVFDLPAELATLFAEGLVISHSEEKPHA